MKTFLLFFRVAHNSIIESFSFSFVDIRVLINNGSFLISVNLRESTALLLLSSAQLGVDRVGHNRFSDEAIRVRAPGYSDGTVAS